MKISLFMRSDLGGARTLDPLIKSQLLYQLSYKVMCIIKCNLDFFQIKHKNEKK